MSTKTILVATAAVLALIARPPAANAGDEAIAAIGGFIGGVIIGSIASDHDHGSSVIIEAGYGDHGDRHYGRNSRYDGPSRHGHSDRRGRWEYQTVSRWIPGYWTYGRDRCGDRRRVWNRGHHVRTQVRIWVTIGGDYGPQHGGRYDG
jgi:hypothetical protein